MVIITIFFTILYCVIGVGVMTLVRITRKDIPKFLAIFWPIVTILCAFGKMDDEL